MTNQTTAKRHRLPWFLPVPIFTHTFCLVSLTKFQVFVFSSIICTLAALGGTSEWK